MHPGRKHPPFSRMKRNFNNEGSQDNENEHERMPGTSRGQRRGYAGKSRSGGHPSHLSGAEIGNFYRQRQMNKSKNEPEKKLGPSITLPMDKIREIRSILRLPQTNLEAQRNANSFLFSDSFDVSFKNEFLKVVSSSFLSHVKESLALKNLTDAINVASDRSITSVDKPVSKEYLKMQEFRRKLPSFKKKNEILELINKNQVILISGETGCGKTTQVSQFILDDAIASGCGTNCRIVCTQPRRISAITVAERVAAERDEPLGESVGYQIRLESQLPRNRGGSILYCTTGILVKFLESDPALVDVTHLILDEIQERNADCDLILGVLKIIMEYRKDLKIILMSATLRAELFSKYFNNCPLLVIEGFTFPVKVKYLEEVLKETNFRISAKRPQKNEPVWKKHTRKFKDKAYEEDSFRSFVEPYLRSIKDDYPQHVIESLEHPDSENINVDLIEALIFHISMTKPQGAILVFLPGLDKISKLHSRMNDSNRYPSNLFQIYSLHSMMPTADQKSVFYRPPKGVRKVIIATNIAETSITIDDVVYVIDSGKQKLTEYSVEENVQTLKEGWETLANATQRRGRAGRVQPGVCYHLFTKAREFTLDAYPPPEILRIRLDEVILKIKILRLGDIRKFLASLPDKTNESITENSIGLLKRLNALDTKEMLTPLGLHLARLPMDPQTGKMILLGAIFGCIDPITSIAANLSFRDAFYRPIGKEREVDMIRRDFAKDTRSDHLMLANVFELWRRSSNKYDFCQQNFLSWTTLKQLNKMKQQFCQHLQSSKFLRNESPEAKDANINSSKTKLLKGIICAGLYPNIAHIKKIKIIRNCADAVVQLQTAEDGRVEIHPSSVNCRQRSFESRYLMYLMKQKSSAIYLFDTTMVNPLPILFFGDMIEVTDGGISVAGFITFKCDSATAKLIVDLREGLNNLLHKKICQPSPIDWEADEGLLLKAIIHLITIDGKNEYSSEDELD